MSLLPWFSLCWFGVTTGESSAVIDSLLLFQDWCFQDALLFSNLLLSISYFCRFIWTILCLIESRVYWLLFYFIFKLGLVYVGLIWIFKFSLKSRIVIVSICLEFSMHLTLAFDYNSPTAININATLTFSPPHHSLLSTPLPSASSYAFGKRIK